MLCAAQKVSSGQKLCKKSSSATTPITLLTFAIMTNMSARFKLPVAVFCVFVKDGKVLLLRRQNTGWYDGSYDLPAGHVDGNESLKTAAQREALEELGVRISLKDIKFAHMAHGFFVEDDKEYIYVLFEIKKWQGQLIIAEPDKCDDLQWFPLKDLPSNLTPGTKGGLKACLSGQPYSEHGFSASN